MNLTSTGRRTVSCISGSRDYPEISARLRDLGCMNVLRNRMSSARLSKIFPRKRVRAGDRRSGVLTRLIEANRAICARGVARIAHGYSQIGSPVPEVDFVVESRSATIDVCNLVEKLSGCGNREGPKNRGRSRLELKLIVTVVRRWFDCCEYARQCRSEMVKSRAES